MTIQRDPDVGKKAQFDNHNTTPGRFNMPQIRITNTSTVEASIVGLSLSVGDPGYTWDLVRDEHPDPGVVATLQAPDRRNHGPASSPGLPPTSDILRYTFSGLTPGKSFDVEADIDPDGKLRTFVDGSVALFSAAESATATFHFDTGPALVMQLPAQPPTSDTYSYSVAD